ncbi:MAG: M23 family metallopeptidase [Hyphomicrobiales bacterium]|nr:M23 family metallopeptidase [Hyphomicrobiales bacterium]
MQQSQVREPNSFGKRKELHSVIITRNGKSRQYCINPLVFSLLAGFIAMFGVGYFSATTYLVLRDDLISARGARNARMQYEYEDRIAALRSNLDLITSRQLLDQQAIETKVKELIKRQKELRRQQPTMLPIIKKAKALGLDIKIPVVDQTITGSVKPDKQASFSDPFDSNFSLRGLGKTQNLALAATYPDKPVFAAVRTSTNFESAHAATRHFNFETANPLFAEIDQSINSINAEQKNRIAGVRRSASSKLIEISQLMQQVGIKISPAKFNSSNSRIGGPYEPLDQTSDFSSHLNALEAALTALEKARRKIVLVPVINPVPGKMVSSHFGSRIDPFKGSYAMHSGYDFKASQGTRVQSTANGKVIFAGLKGGFGKMVEIEHRNGLTTRYAHLSKILVKDGQKILAGKQIGKVGSTGRSTGPHLHYEIRHYDIAVDPRKYLNVGKKLAKLL